jgi:hypothetical protein
MSTAQHSRRHGRRRPKERPAFRGLRQKRFPRRTHQDRIIKFRQRIEVRQNLRVLFLALPEPDPRIDDDARPVDPRVTRPARRSFELARDRPHRILHRRQLRPCFRLPAHMIQDEPGVSTGGSFRQRRVESQSARIVDDFDPVLHGPLGDFRLVRVKRERHAKVAAQALQDRNQPLPFLIRSDPLRAGPRGFRPNVDDVGPMLFQFESARIGPIGIVEAAPIGERIGRNVQHAHQERTLTQLHLRIAQLPIINFSGH